MPGSPDFPADLIARGGGQQDAFAVMAEGEPEAAGLNAPDARGGRVDGGILADPDGFGWSGANAETRAPARAAITETLWASIVRLYPAYSVEDAAMVKPDSWRSR
jgi:hypothetical protein